jgi:hypothetical protein
MTTDEQRYEAGLRRWAKMQGLGLRKSRIDGTFYVFDARENMHVAPAITFPISAYGFDLAEVDQFLADSDRP